MTSKLFECISENKFRLSKDNETLYRKTIIKMATNIAKELWGKDVIVNYHTGDGVDIFHFEITKPEQQDGSKNQNHPDMGGSWNDFETRFADKGPGDSFYNFLTGGTSSAKPFNKWLRYYKKRWAWSEAYSSMPYTFIKTFDNSKLKAKLGIKNAEY
jgi:hypothetical protein